MKKVEQTLAITLRRLCTSPFWCFTTTKAKISNSRCKWMRKNNSNNKMHWTIFCLMNVQAHNEHQLYFSIKKVEVMSSQHCTQRILKQSPMIFFTEKCGNFHCLFINGFRFLLQASMIGYNCYMLAIRNVFLVGSASQSVCCWCGFMRDEKHCFVVVVILLIWNSIENTPMSAKLHFMGIQMKHAN